MSGVLAGYNLAITAVTLVLITDDWELSGFEQGLLASAVVTGGAAGASIAGFLSDRFGRRYVLMSMAALFVASGFGAALAPSLGLADRRPRRRRVRHRCVDSDGWYLRGEIAPAAIRGRLVSIQLVANTLGVMLAYCVGLVLVNAPTGWRLMFGLMALPTAIYGGPGCRDGITALADRRRSAQRGPPLLAAAIRQLGRSRIGRHHRRGRGPGVLITVTPRPAPARLWLPVYRPVVVSRACVSCSCPCFPVRIMVRFTRRPFWSRSASPIPPAAFATTLGLGVISFIATLIAFAVIDQAGRKPLMVTGLFVLAASLLTMAALTVALQEPTVARWGQVACLAVFVAAFGLTLGPISGIVITEIYPQAIRWPGDQPDLGNAWRVRDRLYVDLSDATPRGGLTITLPGYAAIGIAGARYLIRALPETKAKSLEQITRFWNQRAAARCPARFQCHKRRSWTCGESSSG